MIALTPSAFSFSRCSGRGWPPVQNCSFTRRKFLIEPDSCCAAANDGTKRSRKTRHRKVFIMTLLSRKLAVLDAVGDFGCGTEARFAIGFVVGIVAFKPRYFAVAFEREHVRRDAVQKPAIV